MIRGILDTSVFIAGEQDRALGELPEHVAVSTVTLAELELGVLVAEDTAARARRLATLSRARDMFEALVIDQAVASAFASLVAQLRPTGRVLRVQDAWIAATAVAHQAAVCTQDRDFAELPGVSVIAV